MTRRTIPGELDYQALADLNRPSPDGMGLTTFARLLAQDMATFPGY